MDNIFIFRNALKKDLSEIIRLLNEDELGSTREVYNPRTIAPSYQVAFDEILSDPNHALMVVEKKGEIIATCHLTFVPSLTFKGGEKMRIDSVRIDQTLPLFL